AKGQTQQLVADATYSDGTSSPVTNSVTWTPNDTATATVSSAGLLSAVEVGNTTLTATKDGVTSNTVGVNVCASLAGACIDIFDTGTGKLFTNSPSVDYLDSIGGSATNGTYTENGSFGPTGDFYRFEWTNANALCTTYNTLSLGGRTNWRLATRDELKGELYDIFGNMFTARGWPTNTHGYWSATPDGSSYYFVNLYIGDVGSRNPSSTDYASCVSNP
ncbi:Lcl domain-containing protein, partial [Vibrio echinoideorum]|uniref:Lcl domain-containing protein n=1 Tax=Vibrio echinoideorum TaxID=2100116 RepID=UPI003550F505